MCWQAVPLLPLHHLADCSAAHLPRLARFQGVCTGLTSVSKRALARSFRCRACQQLLPAVLEGMHAPECCLGPQLVEDQSLRNEVQVRCGCPSAHLSLLQSHMDMSIVLSAAQHLITLPACGSRACKEFEHHGELQAASSRRMWASACKVWPDCQHNLSTLAAGEEHHAQRARATVAFSRARLQGLAVLHLCGSAGTPSVADLVPGQPCGGAGPCSACAPSPKAEPAAPLLPPHPGLTC